MRVMLVLLLLFAPISARAVARSTPPCGFETPCIVGDRGYHVLPPDDWDGETALPVLMHFHGWQRQGSLIVRHDRIATATRKRGVLLVAPNGLNRTWNFWTDQTRDVSFATSFIEAVAKACPIDRTRIYISGYSFGGAMAWRYVCQSGNEVAALLAISGSIDQSENCPEAPGEARHVHGLTDTVMDFPFGPGGETTYPVKLWRSIYGCERGVSRGQWQARDFLTFERTTWVCETGQVTLDIHPSGHFIPHGWIARQLDELLGLPPSYP